MTSLIKVIIFETALKNNFKVYGIFRFLTIVSIGSYVVTTYAKYAIVCSYV